MMNDPRVESIDVARGLAALSVAIYHYGLGHALAHVTGYSRFELIAWPGYTIAVPVFFVVSGFCIHRGWRARIADRDVVKQFYLQRFFRIYPAWIVAIAVSAFAATVDGHPPSAQQIGTHLALINGFFDDYSLNPVLWSVSVEACLYLIYPAWLFFRRRHGLSAATALALAVSAASALLTSLWFDTPGGPSTWFFLTVWCGWISGAALAELWAAQRRLYSVAWWQLGVVAWLAHGIFIAMNAYSGHLLFLRLPITISLCVWPLALLLIAGEKMAAHRSCVCSRTWHVLAQIGVFSYSLYLLHFPLGLLRYHLDAHLIAWPILRYSVYAGWFGMILCASWSCWLLVEKPLIRIGKRF